jgi:hypothetical protein
VGERIEDFATGVPLSEEVLVGGLARGVRVAPEQLAVGSGEEIGRGEGEQGDWGEGECGYGLGGSGVEGERVGEVVGRQRRGFAAQALEQGVEIQGGGHEERYDESFLGKGVW